MATFQKNKPYREMRLTVVITVDNDIDELNRKIQDHEARGYSLYGLVKSYPYAKDQETPPKLFWECTMVMEWVEKV